MNKRAQCSVTAGGSWAPRKGGPSSLVQERLGCRPKEWALGLLGDLQPTTVPDTQECRIKEDLQKGRVGGLMDACAPRKGGN